MAYTSLYFHLLWSTKYRLPTMHSSLRSELYPLMGGILNKLQIHPEIINGVEDHVHLLVRIPTTVTVAELVRHVKSGSSRETNERAREKVLQWQKKYGAFSVSPRDVPRVREYILNQEAHHRAISYQEEFLGMLHELGIAYDERYLWE